MTHSIKYLTFLALLLSGIALADDAPVNDDAAMAAQHDFKVQTAVATASLAWKEAFNNGDAAAATALYEEDAMMVVKPFGTFKGRQEIFQFWQDLIDKGFDDVVYSDTVSKIVGQNSAQISASWTMNNAHGIITKELWVVQDDGRALLREDHFEVAE